MNHLIRRSTFLHCLFWAPQVFAQVRAPSRNRIEIYGFRFDRDNIFTVSIHVNRATTRSQVVIFLRTRQGEGLQIASDSRDVPVRPRTEDRLLTPEEMLSNSRQLSERELTSKWTASIYSPPASGGIIEMYAVVCDVREHNDSTIEQDYRNLGYLPFRRARSVDDAMRLLQDFGWTPTGYTKAAA